jgi:hypothetical protein
VDERPAAGVFEPGDLLVEDALPDAECLGGLEDAGVSGDDQQAVQASPGTPPDEGPAERFGQVARVETGGRASGDVDAGAAGADGDAVVVGEPVQGMDGGSRAGRRCRPTTGAR